MMPTSLLNRSSVVASPAAPDKNPVFGLTVRAQVGNILNARHRFERVVYDGRRERDDIAFIQKNNQLIGPIFSLSVKGTF